MPISLMSGAALAGDDCQFVECLKHLGKVCLCVVSLPNERESLTHRENQKIRRKRDWKRCTQGATESTYFTGEEMGGWGYTEHPLMMSLEVSHSSPTPSEGVM